MRLILVTGANGALGKSCLEELCLTKQQRCVGFTRATDSAKLFDSSRITYVMGLDLLDKPKVKKAIADLFVEEGIDSIVFIHPVGKFKFEESKKSMGDEDGDGIDDEVFHSNVTTFLSVMGPLLFQLKKARSAGKHIPLTMVAFGSVADKYSIPFWRSYTKSKDILRQLMREIVQEDKENLVRGLFVNVSTTDTGHENQLRPHADKEYWLKPKEIILAVLPFLKKKKFRWEEIDVFKSHPDFHEQDYRDTKKLLARWKKEMGI